MQRDYKVYLKDILASISKHACNGARWVLGDNRNRRVPLFRLVALFDVS